MVVTSYTAGLQVIRDAVRLTYKSGAYSGEQVRYFYGEDAARKAETYVENRQPHWYEIHRVQKTIEKIGGSDVG